MEFFLKVYFLITLMKVFMYCKDSFTVFRHPEQKKQRGVLVIDAEANL